MSFSFKNNKISPPLLVCLAYVFCAGLGMLISPHAFDKFFSFNKTIPQVEGYYWDVQYYAAMALKDKCGAFYPLWPSLIRTLFHPQTIDQAAHYFFLVGNLLFFLSIFPLYGLFKKAFNDQYTAFLCTIAYALNPMSIFHSIGYTESLFSCLTIIFIWAFLGINRFNLKLITLLFIAFIMSLTRPVVVQIIFASSASLLTIFVLRMITIDNFSFASFKAQINRYISEIIITITLLVAAILGYCVYGFSCVQLRGNFFAPFNDQKDWGKHLGLHLSSLFMPRTTFFDLMGFYFSLLILLLSVIFIYCKIKNKELLVFIPQSPLWNFLILYPPLLIVLYITAVFLHTQHKTRVALPARGLTYFFKGNFNPLKISDYAQKLTENYLFWFSIYFAVIHAIILFLIDDYLTSLGRFIFALPFFFIALGYLSRCLSEKKLERPLLWLTAFSAITLVRQWVFYGQDKWLG